MNLKECTEFSTLVTSDTGTGKTISLLIASLGFSQ